MKSEFSRNVLLCSGISYFAARTVRWTGFDLRLGLTNRVSRSGWCNLHNAGCIMQVAGHVLWPRAAWLYHGATLLMTLSVLVSGGLVSKLTLGRQKLPFYDIILVRVSYRAWNKFDD